VQCIRAREEHAVFRDIAAERREVAVRHAARERAFRGEHLVASRFELALRGGRRGCEQ
jgi:hypothetical protein